jgi:mannose-6-phosphate isomerase-like protein (cupin superfamily)
MSSTVVNSNDSIVPVVLAGSSNLKYWPLSRVLNPIQFQRKKREQSSFQTALLCATSLPNSKNPLVFVAAGQLNTAKTQADQVGLLSVCRFIVEPVERGNWNAMVLASLRVALSDPNQMMMFIDAKSSVANAAALAKTYQHIRQNMPEKQMVVLGDPYDRLRDCNASLVKRTERSVVHSLLQVEPFCPTKIAQTDRHNLYSIGAIVMACPNDILEMARSSDREAFQTIDAALRQSNDISDAFWINLNMWNVLETKCLGDELIKQTDQFLLRPTDILKPSKTENSSLSFTRDNVNCSITNNGHVIAMVGCSNLKVTSTRDATLIQSNDSKIDFETLTNEMREAQCSELFHSPICHRPWGTETLLQQSKQSQVYKIELHPGASIAEHFHTHRKENWQILSGLGTATISDVTHQIATGWTYSIDKNTLHSCTSSKNHPLVLLETRFGEFLNENDLVHTQVKNGRSYSAGTKASSPP